MGCLVDNYLGRCSYLIIVYLNNTTMLYRVRYRKAVRAAVLLLPLLGITNLLNMTKAPLDRSVWEFALWSYTTHFLTSFQGLIIAFLYCFLNGEVSQLWIFNPWWLSLHKIDRSVWNLPLFSSLPEYSTNRGCLGVMDILVIRIWRSRSHVNSSPPSMGWRLKRNPADDYPNWPNK